jgi:hypothetical protein
MMRARKTKTSDAITQFWFFFFFIFVLTCFWFSSFHFMSDSTFTRSQDTKILKRRKTQVESHFVRPLSTEKFLREFFTFNREFLQNSRPSFHAPDRNLASHGLRPEKFQEISRELAWQRAATLGLRVLRCSVAAKSGSASSTYAREIQDFPHAVFWGRHFSRFGATWATLFLSEKIRFFPDASKLCWKNHFLTKIWSAKIFDFRKNLNFFKIFDF